MSRRALWAGNFAGMSWAPGGVPKVCEKLRACFSFPKEGLRRYLATGTRQGSRDRSMHLRAGRSIAQKDAQKSGDEDVRLPF